MGQIREPDDGSKGDEGEKGDGDEAEGDSRSDTAQRFAGNRRAGHETRVSQNVVFEVFRVVVDGEEDAESGHHASEKMIEFVFCEERDDDDNLDREHENALPPAVEADRCQVMKLVGQSTEGGDGRKQTDQFEPRRVGDAPEPLAGEWRDEVARDREQGGGTEDKDEY